MMLGIMQPYLFPYIGYFQLAHAVDTFVIYDDVQYITRGWIHRNRFLQNGQENLFTFSLKNDSSRKNINQRYFTSEFEEQCAEFLKMLQFSYGNAPYFERTRQMVEDVFTEMDPGNHEENIALKIGRSIRVISRFLNLDTDFVISSELEKDNDKSGQESIIEINKIMGSNCYTNPINGKELYSREKFIKHDLQLLFLKPGGVQYDQFGDEFIPWLSIVDVCMFNDREEIKELLSSYALIK